jgi:hypothetical protein
LWRYHDLCIIKTLEYGFALIEYTFLYKTQTLTQRDLEREVHWLLQQDLSTEVCWKNTSWLKNDAFVSHMTLKKTKVRATSKCYENICFE